MASNRLETQGKERRNKMATSKERDKEHPKGHLAMKTPPIVSQQEWEAARQQLLVKEKALTRSRDALAAERRRMPWLAGGKEDEFEGPKGKVSLLDLFEGRRQLIVYRAFFEPGVFGWPEHACRGCSLGADQVAHLSHLNARDTTLAYASRAPQADIARLKARMGWEMPWYTITDGFDADFGVDEWHGHNVFFRDGDKVFRTYFINSRGDEAMGTTWSYLDIIRSAVRRLGRTRQRVTPRRRRTSGGTGTTTTAPRRCLARSGARCPTLEKPPSESATSATRTTSTPPTADRGAPTRRRARPGDRCGSKQALTVDAVTLEKAIKGRPLVSQPPRRLDADAGALSQHVLDVIGRSAIEMRLQAGVPRRDAGPLGRGSVEGEICDVDELATTQHRAPLDGVFQLPDIARPLVGQQPLLGVIGPTRKPPAERLVLCREKDASQRQHVVAALAQRRNAHGNDG